MSDTPAAQEDGPPRCRRCGTPALPLDSDICRRCPRCGYYTCIESLIEWSDALLLRDIYETMRPPPSARLIAEEAEKCADHLISIRRRLVGELLEWATLRPADASHLLLQSLREAGRIDGDVTADRYHLKGDVFRWVQTIYAVAVAAGSDLSIARVSSSSLTAREIDLRSKQVAAVTDMSKLIVRFTRSEIDLRVRGGAVQLRERIDDLLGIELIQNIARSTADLEGYRLIDEDVSKIQTEVLGFALSDLDGKLPSHGISLEDSGLVIVEHDELSPPLEALARRLRLTENVLRQSEYPDFFNLAAERESPRSDFELVETSAEMLWSMYFPLLPIGHLTSAATSVTAGTLIIGPAAAAAGGRAHMLELLSRESSKIDRDTSARVKRKIQEYHSKFEALVARRAEMATMRTKSPVDRVRGARLTCGEIDVLCLGQMANGGDQFLLVIEVKNTDRPMHKSGGIGQVRTAITSAARQAKAKAAWVDAHLDLVLQDAFELSNEQTGVIPVFPLIVTRELVPLGWSSPVPAFTLSDFTTECKTMNEALGFDSWRPDLLRTSLLS